MNAAIARLLSTIEGRLLAKARSPKLAPIFVIGLPRVGSTLVYHALVRRFGLSYLCNAAASFPRTPVTATAGLRCCIPVTPGADFRNRYGVTPGWTGPAQGREMWGRWFPADQSHVGPGVLDVAARAEIRGTVAGIESAFGLPFVNKAQGNAVRVHALCETFEDALFVRVNRDHLTVAESILRGRRECFGDEHKWFSAKPSNVSALLPLDPFGQIAGQIAGVEADMDKAFRDCGRERVMDIGFRQFCASPGATLDRVRLFYEGRTGMVLRERHQLPSRFEPIEPARVPAADSDRLRRALNAVGVPA